MILNCAFCPFILLRHNLVQLRRQKAVNTKNVKSTQVVITDLYKDRRNFWTWPLNHIIKVIMVANKIALAIKASLWSYFFLVSL